MIPVIIFEDGGNDESRKDLCYAFSDKTFEIIEIKKVAAFSPLEAEKNMILTGLAKAKQINPLSNCVLVRDTSVAQVRPDLIAELGKYNLKGFDVLYLGRWADGCNLYRDEEEYAEMQIVSTTRPGGFQAIIISPSLRDTILSPTFAYTDPINVLLMKLIYQQFFRAKTLVNNVFNFDIVRFARTNDDFNKMNICTNVVSNKSGIKAQTYFFVAALIVLIVLVGIGLYLAGPKIRSTDDDLMDNDIGAIDREITSTQERVGHGSTHGN